MINYEQYWVPAKNERKEWMKKILDKVSRYYGGRAIQDRRFKYALHQQRIRGEIRTEDFEYVWKTYGLPKPMSFINYPLLETHIDGLVGGFLSSPLVYDVWKVNENAVSEKIDMKARIVFAEMAEPIWQMIEKQTGVALEVEDRISSLPDDVRKFKNYDIRDMLEDAIFYSIYDLIIRYGIQAQLGNALNDLCENGFAFGKICYNGNDPYIKHIPIVNSICDLPLTSQPYSDTSGQNLLGEDHFMNFEEVCDSYGWMMTEEDLENLKSTMSTYYQMRDMTGYNADCVYFYVDTFSNEVYVRITDIQVRAMVNKQFVAQVQENADTEPPKVDKPLKEVHCGIRIGRDIYKTYKKKNQIPDKDNYTDLQSDYFGVFTKSNLYRKGWGFQMLYNVINMHIEFLVNQSGGKASRYNMANKPEGYEIDDLVYMGKVQGIIPEQPQPGTTGSVSAGEIDYGLGVGFQYLVEAKREIESSMGKLTGVAPERIGQGSPYASAKLSQQQLAQSTFVTAPIFHALTKFTEMGFQRMSDLVKYLWAKDEWKSIIVGDMGLKAFRLTQDLMNWDYGLYVKNSMNETATKQVMVEMMEKTLATSPEMIKETIKVINAVSGKEAQKIVENAIDVMLENKAKSEQMQQKLEAANTQVLQSKAENDKLRAEAARYTPIDVAQIMRNGRTQDILLKNYTDQSEQMQDQSHERDMTLFNQTHEQQMAQMQPPQAAPAQ